MEMITKLKERFRFIEEKDVWLYLENVVNRLPDKEKKELFKNKRIEIITIKKERGCQISFSNPIDSLIYLNFKVISELKYLEEKTYLVAHEIAHHFAGRGKSGLREKEADDLLRKWGFEKEIKAAGYLAPKNEEKGYDIGYKWAYTQNNKELWERYRCFLKLWTESNLDKWAEDDLEEELILESNSDRIIPLKEHGQPTDNKEIKKGFAFGIMKRVRELGKQEEGE